MDDLADKLGMDPLEFRLKNLNPTDFRTPIYQAELKMGAELIGWSEKRKPRGRNGAGPIKHGMGVALHQWGGGGGQDKKVSCTINPDGSVETQDARPRTWARASARCWRSSPPRSSGSSRPTSSRASAIRITRRARLRAARPRRRPWRRRPTTR